MNSIVMTGSFDNLQARSMRLLQEAARLGPVHAFVWSDAAVRQLEGQGPRFPIEERIYMLEAVRYIHRVTVVEPPIGVVTLPADQIPRPATWVVDSITDRPAYRAWCRDQGIGYRTVDDATLHGFPDDSITGSNSLMPDRVDCRAAEVLQSRRGSPMPAEKLSVARNRRCTPDRKVIVTGCYDWLHSGHIRFFEEVSQLGILYVVVGHDANIRLLKGAGHPLFPEQERRYMAGSIRYVHQALISSGHGWLDAEPEIERIRPAVYAVNEDGDQPEKRTYCEAHGIEYIVLHRTPKTGLPKRQSTDLRGF